MTPTETVSRLRRLADDWRKEEKQLCEQFGSEIVPRSLRARRIKDTKAIDAAVEMIERLEQIEAAAQNLVKMKGRHNTEIAYQRLVDALEKSK